MYRPYTNPVGNPAGPMDVETTIRGLTQDLCTAFNTGNYDQVAILYATDGMFMAPHHESAMGPKAIERELREFGEAGYQDLRLDTERVDYSGDMAMEVGRYAVKIVRENGVTEFDRGKYVKVWRRLGAWRMVADCWSTNLPVGTGRRSEEKPTAVADNVTSIGEDVPKSA